MDLLSPYPHNISITLHNGNQDQEWTIKNNYPLSWILDIMENIGTKKVFTKLDLWWDYNNLWIKKEDE